MNPINASSLFHFTDSIDNLKGILANGFRFSYCCEFVSETIIVNKLHPNNASFFRPTNSVNPYIALPMICFCDIPLTRVKSHSDIYGSFIVGIDKNMAQTIYSNLNPILYISSGFIMSALSDLSVVQAQNFDIQGCYNLDRSIYQIIGNTKPYKGEFRGLKDYCFYNEREWRVLIPYDYDTKIQWCWNVNPDEFELNQKQELNKVLQQTEFAYIGFVKELTNECDEENFSQLITHIVVDKDENIPEIVDYILNSEQKLFQYSSISQETRKILASKITSFERIEKDY